MNNTAINESLNASLNETANETANALTEVFEELSDVTAEELVSAKFWSHFDWSGILSFIAGYAWHIFGSILILYIGHLIINKLSSILLKILHKSSVLDMMLTDFAINALKTLLYIFIFLAALSNIGINTTSFVAVLGAMGLAVGMAFKDTFGNIGAGVLIIFFRPFRLDDSVDISGSIGKVVKLNLFSTHILTADGKTIIIPNLQVIAAKIVNYSLTGTRRVDVIFSIDYNDNIGTAKAVLQRLTQKNEKILQAPEVFIGVNELAANSVDIIVKCWVQSSDYWEVYHYLLEEGKISLEAAGLSIPFPQLVTHAA